MESSYSIEITSIEEPTILMPQDSPFSDCFYINFSCTHEFRTQPTNSTSELPPIPTTVVNKFFLVPWDILCECTELTVQNRDNTIFLQETFSSMPIYPELLDSILPIMGEFARNMIVSSYEGCNMWEMGVTLHITTRRREDYCDVDLYQHAPIAAQIVNLLEKVKIDHASRYSTEQCSICLEEFCHGSSSELVRTNCLHVFHEDCIFRWLLHCINRQSSYSCPLCRCLTIPSTSKGDE